MRRRKGVRRTGVSNSSVSTTDAPFNATKSPALPGLFVALVEKASRNCPYSRWCIRCPLDRFVAVGWAMPAFAGEPYRFPPSFCPSITRPAGSGAKGQARDGLRWPREWTRRPPWEGVAKVRPGLCDTRKGKSAIFPFLAETTAYRCCFWQHILVLREVAAKLPLLLQPPWEGAEIRRTSAVLMDLAEREKRRQA